MVLFQRETEGCLVLRGSDSDQLMLLQTHPQLKLSTVVPGQGREREAFLCVCWPSTCAKATAIPSTCSALTVCQALRAVH